MRDFFKSLFASLVALTLFAGLGFLLFIGIVAAMGPSAPTVPPKAILVFDLATPIPDSTSDGGARELVDQALGQGSGQGMPLADILSALDRAASDTRIAALYLTGNVGGSGYSSGMAALKEVREAIARVKAAGKPVIAYNHAWSKRDLYVASGATSLGINPMGEVDLTGLAAEPMFFAGALKKAGLEVQVTRVGRFKSAVEPFILEKMSDANREQTQKYLGDLWEEWKQAVAADRKQSPETLQALADTKGPLSAAEAKAAGLVDRITTQDEVLDELKKLSGKEAKHLAFPQMDLAEYAKVPGGEKGRQRLAVVYAEGDIVDGEGAAGEVGGERLARELRRLRLDKDVKAIVLRVNSPGGSAMASEVIQRETVLLKQAGKPLVISMGTVAASGGYWISAYGDRIFAEPNTLTGSIGVFGMLPNAQKLLGTLGVGVDRVQTSKLAHLMTITRPKTAEEMARIQTHVDHIYDQFLAKVAEGRKMSREAVHEIAQGRVWSGREAHRLGLVDELGGLQAAVRHAAKLAKIEQDYRIDAAEPAKSPVEKLLGLLGGGEKRKVVKTGPVQVLQDDLIRTFERLKALNDPSGVYARLPMDLAIR